jgi:ribosome-binding factor A
MSRRTEKVASTIRQVLSQGIATKISDPRISQFTSITRVEVSGDMMHATVYVSVLGSDVDGRKTLAGLENARGFLQSILAKKLTTRHCPTLRFEADKGIKKQMETLALIDQVSEEHRQVDEARERERQAQAEAGGADDDENASPSPGESL